MLYNRDLKKKLCEKICIDHYSTLKTANEYGIPIKTLEKWVTAFNKDNHCFDPIILVSNDFKIINNIENKDYSNLTNDELKYIIMKKDIEIARLKKGYMVKGVGAEKEFVTTFDKNTK